MKVIFSLVSSFPFHGAGGLEKFYYYLAKLLIQEGVAVDIVVPLDKGKARTEVYNGINYVFLPPKVEGGEGLSTARLILFSISLARYLKKQSFDILYGSSTIICPYLHFKNRAPTIFHGFDYELTFFTWKNQQRGLKKLIYVITREKSLHYCLTHADAFVTPLDSQARKLAEMGFDEAKIFTLTTGVDISQVKQRIRTAKLIRKDLGIGEDDIVLLDVNRFTQERGFNYLVDAFAIIKRKIRNAKLILIGRAMSKAEEITYKEIQNQIIKLKLSNAVICLKNVPEDTLYSYYNVSDIYISPTVRTDPFLLMGIQEAMVCGLPIVRTSQEYEIKSMPNGYLVPKENPQAIAKAILRIHEKNEYKALGDASREMAKNYNLEVIARRALELCEELAQKSSSTVRTMKKSRISVSKGNSANKKS